MKGDCDVAWPNLHIVSIPPPNWQLSLRIKILFLVVSKCDRVSYFVIKFDFNAIEKLVN